MKSKKKSPETVIRRREPRLTGLFIDGTSLDRAGRRLGRRIDMAALVRGLTPAGSPQLVRYYTLIPFEDDSRQRAFLDSLSRSGLSVLVKRLPPKSVTKIATIDLEMACDIVAFAAGQSALFKAQESGVYSLANDGSFDRGTKSSEIEELTKREIITVCPPRELSYAIALCKELGADTTTADFSQSQGGDVMKSASKWIDLTTSETIWMEER